VPCNAPQLRLIAEGPLEDDGAARDGHQMLRGDRRVALEPATRGAGAKGLTRAIRRRSRSAKALLHSLAGRPSGQG
jgi:hypothetical protein